MKHFLTALLAVSALTSVASAQTISVAPIPSGPQRPLFGGPPEYSNLPFDIRPNGTNIPLYTLTLDRHGNFFIGFSAQMHKRLTPDQTGDDSTDSNDTDDDAGQTVSLKSHMVMDKTQWGSAFNNDPDSLYYFSHYAVTALQTETRYGKSRAGVELGMITEGEKKGSLYVRGPDVCQYVLSAKQPDFQQGTIDFGYNLEDVNKGCRTAAFPTEVHITLTLSNSLLEIHDGAL